MALNYTPKEKASSAPTTRPNERPQVNYSPKPSTARVENLKAKLTGKPAPQPVAPRKAGSTARQQEFSQMQKFVSQAPAPQAPPMGNSTARQATQDLSQIEPPPSGLAEGMEAPIESDLSQVNTSVEPQGVKPAEATSEPLSPQFVALAKKEQLIRRAQKEQKAREAAWKQDQAKYVSKDELISNPLKALTEAGVTYDRLVELQLDQANPDPNQVLKDEIAELKKQLAVVNEQFTKRDTQAYDSAVNQIRNDVKLLVDSDPAFETIKATEQSEDVVELIKKVFDAEGSVLPVEEACKLIEEKLLDREYQRVERLMKLPKIKSRMAPPTEPSAEAMPLQPQTQKSTTLTNQGAVQRPLSARDRAIMRVQEAMQKKLQ